MYAACCVLSRFWVLYCVDMYLGGPIASSMYGTVQLSSMTCPEMSKETRLPKLCTMLVRIFRVSLNLVER